MDACCHVEYCWWGRASVALGHGEAPEQVKGNVGRAPGCHSLGPCNGRGVVKPDAHLGAAKAFRSSDGLQDGLVEEHHGHFQVGVGQTTLRIGVRYDGSGDIGGALDPPYNWFQLLGAVEPYTPGAESTGVAVTGIIELVLDQLANMGGTAGKVADDDDDVQQCLANAPVSAQADKGGFKALLSGVKNARVAGKM
jgi:hypothetical protein